MILVKSKLVFVEIPWTKLGPLSRIILSADIHSLKTRKPFRTATCWHCLLLVFLIAWHDLTVKRENQERQISYDFRLWLCLIKYNKGWIACVHCFVICYHQSSQFSSQNDLFVLMLNTSQTNKLTRASCVLILRASCTSNFIINRIVTVLKYNSKMW